MRKTLHILFLLLLFQGSAQTWVTIDGQQYEPLSLIQWNPGFTPGNKQFKVNRYNNWIWMANNTFAHGFDNNGNYFRFDHTVDTLFQEVNAYSTILEFEFTPTQTFLVDKENGVLKYDGINWSRVANGWTQEEDSVLYVNICVDGDSIWVSNDWGKYYAWKNGLSTSGACIGLNRMAARNGEFWGTTSMNGIFGDKIYPIINDVLDYGSGLIPGAEDFKFSPNTDTLYASGPNGIALIHNGVIVDSITPNNSANMPGLLVGEFELDQYDNIWALFGVGYSAGAASFIGYYDRSLNSWTQIYDINNSPIDFMAKVRIELDSAGNLYVTDLYDLHILKISNWPSWVGVEEHAKEPKELIKTVDLIGRETEDKPNTVLIYIYSDGTTEKVFRVE